MMENVKLDKLIKDIAGIKLIRIEFVGKAARQPDLPHAGAEVFEAVMDDCLTDKQKRIIRAHYGFDGPACTDRAFAEKAGLSTGYVRHARGMALCNMAHICYFPRLMPGYWEPEDFLGCQFYGEGLRAKLVNRFRKAGINYVGEVVCRTEEQLMSIPGIDEGCIGQLKDFLGCLGLSLAPMPPHGGGN